MGDLAHARKLVDPLKRLHSLYAFKRKGAITPQNVKIITFFLIRTHFKVSPHYFTKYSVLGVININYQSRLFVFMHNFLLECIVDGSHC